MKTLPSLGTNAELELLTHVISSFIADPWPLFQEETLADIMPLVEAASVKVVYVFARCCSTSCCSCKQLETF